MKSTKTKKSKRKNVPCKILKTVLKARQSDKELHNAITVIIDLYQKKDFGSIDDIISGKIVVNG